MSNISWANQESQRRGNDATRSRAETHIDYDIHGVVAVRLVNCPPADAAAIDRKFWLFTAPIGANSRHYRSLRKGAASPGLTHLGLRQYAYTETDFFLIAEERGNERT